MQHRDFDELRGTQEFSLDDRRKVKDVFERVLDEMGDSHELSSMFVPYANIVYKALTDGDITLQIQEEAAYYAFELEELDGGSDEE